MSHATELPDIIVTGRRIPSGIPPFFDFPSSRGGSTTRGGGTSTAFVPPILPTIIEEIIVTAPRPVPVSPLAPSLLTRFNLASFLAVLGGTLFAEILRDISQADLDESLRRFKAVGKRPKSDTPVLTIQPEVLDVVTVTARRLQPRTLFPSQLLVRAPQVIFTEQIDFREMVVMTPFFLPETAPAAPTVPGPVRVPLPLGIPLPVTLPLGLPLPFALPAAQPLGDPVSQPLADPVALPFAQPLADPLADPLAQPFAQPVVGPKVFTPVLTAPQPVGVPSPLAQPTFDIAGQVCPPCTKVDEQPEEPRLECFKKLVKESIFPQFDESFNWTEIDCFTGQEL